jgi:hypothetical protein
MTASCEHGNELSGSVLRIPCMVELLSKDSADCGQSLCKYFHTFGTSFLQVFSSIPSSQHLEYYFLGLRDEISLLYSVSTVGSIDTPYSYIHRSLQHIKYQMMA